MWNYRCQAFDLAPIKEPLKRYVQATKVESNTIHRPIITCTHPTRSLKPTVSDVLNVTSINCFMWVFFYFNGWVLLPATVRTWLLASGNDSDPFLVAHCSEDHYTPKPQVLYPHGHQQSAQLQREYFTCASHPCPSPTRSLPTSKSLHYNYGLASLACTSYNMLYRYKTQPSLTSILPKQRCQESIFHPTASYRKHSVS